MTSMTNHVTRPKAAARRRNREALKEYERTGGRWTDKTTMISNATGVSYYNVIYWRRRMRIEAIRRGEALPQTCTCGKRFDHIGDCKTEASIVRKKKDANKPRHGFGEAKSLLNEKWLHLATEWSTSNAKIAELSGIHISNIQNWRRDHVRAYIAETGKHPDCNCGLPFMHMLGCIETTPRQRSLCESMLNDGESLDKVARAIRGTPGMVVSIAYHVLGPAEARARIGIERALREKRKAPIVQMRRVADEAHGRILASVGHYQDSDDAAQEAYLAMLESGLDVESAISTGRRTAARMNSVGWRAKSLDAAIYEDGSGSMLDMIADPHGMDAFDEVLARIDAERKGDAEWSSFSTAFDNAWNHRSEEIEDKAEAKMPMQIDKPAIKQVTIKQKPATPQIPVAETVTQAEAPAVMDVAPIASKEVSDDMIVERVERLTLAEVQANALIAEIDAARIEAAGHKRRGHVAREALATIHRLAAANDDITKTRTAPALAA